MTDNWIPTTEKTSNQSLSQLINTKTHDMIQLFLRVLKSRQVASLVYRTAPQTKK